jgi:regulator of nucleoside diphosphate kinase
MSFSASKQFVYLEPYRPLIRIVLTEAHLHHDCTDTKEQAMRELPIVITQADAVKLRGLIATRARTGHDQDHLQELSAELERARIADAAEAPPDLITLHSQVRVLDLASGKRRELTLVLPPESDPAQGRISVLAPLGTALLGYRAGDELEWQMPGGMRRVRIESVESQLAGAAA